MIDDRDLDRLRLRGDLDENGRQQWRAQVHKAAARVGSLYVEGRLGDSREEASAAAADLAKLIARAPAHRDPHRDLEDPRALADAVRNRTA